MSSINFAPHTLAIFESIARHTPNGGLTRKTIMDFHEKTFGKQKVSTAICNLKDREYIYNIGRPSNSGAIYVIKERKVRESKVLRDLEVTKQVITHSKASPSGASLAPSLSDRPNYDGKELIPFDGRPGANDHMKWGSLIGGVFKPYMRPSLRREG